MQRAATSVSVALVLAAGVLAQQLTPADRHFGTAMAAAQKDFTPLFDSTCGYLRPTMAFEPPAPPTRPQDRASWHRDPARVFDNLYFLGQSEYSAWAVTTSDGIIVMDTLFDYSAEDEIVNGLTMLGLDPKQIKYAVVSHAHGDHIGGAKLLQDRGARIVMSAADWDLLDRGTAAFPKPKRDVVATDGQKLTLGDTTLTLYITPGHTLGTLSTLIPVRDGRAAHTAAYWGGTAFNWIRGPGPYITPDRPASFWFDTYAKSARRFRDVAARASVDVLLSNHTKYDGTPGKLEQLARRRPGAPHPYVVGTAAVQRFLTVAEECALAGAS